MDYIFKNKITRKEVDIYNKDNRYRTTLIDKYYQDVEFSESIKFLNFFCAHCNVKKLDKQISKVFNSNVYDFKSLSYPEKFIKLCDIFSNEIKSKFKVFPKDKREENIRLINSFQEENIIERNTKFSKILYDKFNNKIKFKITGRSLILYFRKRTFNEEQVDYLEFSIMYYILNWYINNGYSKVFNKLSVASRINGEYPNYLDDLFEDFNYLNVSNDNNSNVENFKFVTSVGANLIHFADGDYWDQAQEFSTPIVSESINFLKRETIKEDLLKQKKCVLMKGIYYDYLNNELNNELNFKENLFKIKKRNRNTGDFLKLMNTILNTVIELEDKIIYQARNNTKY